MRADAAAFAVVQISLEKSVFGLLHASFRAKDVTDAAFDAFGVVPDGTLGPPTAGVIFTGAPRFGNNAADRKLLPCL